MGKKIKKGTKGSAVNFISRTQAIKKLQITLPEFRKLCILKGVFPRQPKKTPKGGKHRTYYFKKDILYIQHDPLMKKFRERRIWRRKLTRAKNKKERENLEYLRAHKPRYNLNHLVKERYPTFMDALRDIDDALTNVSLFAMMPSTIKIAPERIKKCQRLCREFQYYVAKTNSLRKVFLSFKGIYYQAEILGQTITWLCPYKYTQKVVKNVDYKVLLSFLEFYEVLMGFVNFKLFHSIGLRYPPKLSDKINTGENLEAILEESNADKIEISARFIENTEKDKQQEEQKNKTKERLSTLSEAIKNIKEESEESENSESEEEEDEEREDRMEDNNSENKLQENNSENNDEDNFEDEETAKLRKKQEVYSSLFKNCVFWLSREVPREPLEFIIKSFGGKCTWEEAGKMKHDDRQITHHVMDRDKIIGEPVLTCEYVQPQYVFDCANSRFLIPTADYGPGKPLPPHLSPFVDDYAVGYVPEYRKKLDDLYRQKHGGETMEILPDIIESEESDEEERFARELQSEKGGKYDSEKNANKNGGKQNNKRKKTPRTEEEEQRETAVALLPQKKRRMINKVTYGKRMKQSRIKKLQMKRNKLASGRAEIKDGVIVDKPRTMAVTAK